MKKENYEYKNQHHSTAGWEELPTLYQENVDNKSFVTCTEEVKQFIQQKLDERTREIVGILYDYEDGYEKKYREFSKRHLVMHAYDMHSRGIAVKHIKEKILHKYNIE